MLLDVERAREMVCYKYQRVEYLEEWETVAELLDSRHHVDEEDSQEHNISKCQEQIIQSHTITCYKTHRLCQYEYIFLCTEIFL